jgi:hypothetical protein
MFEIDGTYIQRLSDVDLRRLVYQLASADLVRQGLPRSGVTAGGHQNAPDGGIDVRVDVPNLVAPDFVACAQTGFQVKVPDMAAAAIKEEVSPKGVLRPSISKLAAVGGAYIIVSGNGSVADQALRDREEAMTEAVSSDPNADRLLTRFYDRDRLASWVNKYPGAVLWVRDKLGEPLSGWHRITDHDDNPDAGYVIEHGVSLKHETTKEIAEMPVLEGISRLREHLAEPATATRIIGLSGLGKTRLVEALFESSVGEGPLDQNLSVYCDFAAAPVPTAIDMARRLVARNERAILIVDNCNPATHQSLTTICQAQNSQVSLLTVEYDIRDDEREDTEVFRLVAAENPCIESWLEKAFPKVSGPDRRRISEYSTGNFRIAGSLARTVNRGDTLANLRDDELFQRLFVQRNAENPDLRAMAGFLSLQYSFCIDGTDATSELAGIAALSQKTPEALFAASTELVSRGIAQSRGRWRAILPHAIANKLACEALARLTPAAVDQFASMAAPRVLKSLSRRIGLLHHDATARALVERWLSPASPFGNLLEGGEVELEIARNIAPVVPRAVLNGMDTLLQGPLREFLLSIDNPNRWRWIGLAKSLGYEEASYSQVAGILADFAAAEPDGYNNSSALGTLKELHHIHLSGTQATPGQRRQFVRSLLVHNRADLKAIGIETLKALLNPGRFSSSANFDFGARPRNYGWQPPTYGDIWLWYVDAIKLAMEFEAEIDTLKEILASPIRQLWRMPPCRDEIESLARHFVDNGTGWIEGWNAVRGTLRFDGNEMDKTDRDRLLALEESLRPQSTLDRARAYVIGRQSSGFDVTDSESENPVHSYNRAAEIAIEIGIEVANNQAFLEDFVPQVLATVDTSRSFQFGIGLCRGAKTPVTTWNQISECFLKLQQDKRDPNVLGGFICELQKLAPEIALTVADAIWSNDQFRHWLPYLITRNGLNEGNFERLIEAARSGLLTALDFRRMHVAVDPETEPKPLAELLDAIADLEDGVPVALDTLFFHLYDMPDSAISPVILGLGRGLLERVNFLRADNEKDYHVGQLIKKCLRGEEGEVAATSLCNRLNEAFRVRYHSYYEHRAKLDSLFEVQPETALNILVLHATAERRQTIFDFDGDSESGISCAGIDRLLAWADVDPAVRFRALCEVLPMIITPLHGGEPHLSPTFLALLLNAPNKQDCLGNMYDRMHPRGWGGSLAYVLETRGQLLDQLVGGYDSAVDEWVHKVKAELAEWIERERTREGQEEQAFE